MKTLRFSIVAVILGAIYSLGNGDVTRGGGGDGSLRYRVTEDQPPGSVIARLGVDSGLETRYSRDVRDSFVFDVFHGPFSDLFVVENPAGIVRTNRTIDRDEICFKQETCVLRVDVAIVRPAQFFQVFKLSVTVDDTNDNTPQFDPTSVTLTISESVNPGSVILLPAALDRDQGPLDVQTYTLTTNDTAGKFGLRATGIGSESGVPGEVLLVVKERLDREKEAVYSARLTASDGGQPPKTGNLDITILIQDANDNAPTFVRPLYNVTVREDFPVNGIIVSVHAADQDEGLNAQVVYAFAASTQTAHGDMFVIDSDRGAVSLKRRLDREMTSVYQLVVSAVDLGPDSSPTYCRVVVNVEDRNDNAPTIRVNALTSRGDAEVAENLPPGSFVAHVSVDDVDTGVNGQVTCELLRAGNSFLLEPLPSGTEYKLLTNQAFDRESRDEFSITVVCHDDGLPSLSASRDVTVRVADVNDHSPEFDRSTYIVAVREDAEIGLPLVRLTATDRDAGDNGRIEFVVCDATDVGAAHISVSNSSGLVSTGAQFDYETAKQFQICVSAMDGGSPRRVTNVSIVLNVVDVNDNAPTFTQSAYTFGTFENQPPDTEVGRVTAVDPDSPPFDRFIYAVVRELPPLDAFVVDPKSGRLSTTRELDREQTSVHHIIVRATDIARTELVSTANVTVFVADRNDNAPIISFPLPDNNTVEVSRYAPAGFTISRIFAHDVDFAKNARLTFRIVSGNADSLFDIDPALGAISVATDLRHSVRDRHDLLVTVSDAGEPEKSSAVRLAVTIVDTEWTPEMQEGMDGMESPGDHGLGLFGKHGLILVGLAAITALLIMLLVSAIVCVRCKQNKNKKRAAYSKQQEKDPKASANLIIENVSPSQQRHNECQLNINTLQADLDLDIGDPVATLTYPLNSQNMNMYEFADQCGACDPRILHNNYEPRLMNQNIRTISLPFRSNIQQRPQHQTTSPDDYYQTDQIPLDRRYHTMQQIQQQYCVHPSRHPNFIPQTHSSPINSPTPAITPIVPYTLCSSNTPNAITTIAPHSPAESDSTSGCSSAGGSNASDRDGSPQHVIVPGGNGIAADGGPVGGGGLEQFYAGSRDDNAVFPSPVPSSCPSSPAPAAGAEAVGMRTDRPHHQAAKNCNIHDPPPVEAPTLPSSACCAGCVSRSPDVTSRDGPGAVSRGVGYCCTVQPIMEQSATGSNGVEGNISGPDLSLQLPTQQWRPQATDSTAAGTQSVGLNSAARRSPSRFPNGKCGVTWSDGGGDILADMVPPPPPPVDRGGGRRPPPPVPPPRLASLRRDQTLTSPQQ